MKRTLIWVLVVGLGLVWAPELLRLLLRPAAAQVPARSLVSATASLARHVSQIAWKPDGSALAVGYSDGMLEIRNGSTGELQQTLIGHSNYITTLAWHPTANELLSGSDGQLFLWNLSTHESLDFQSIYDLTYSPVDRITWNEDGSRIFVSSDISLLIWDASTSPPQFVSQKRYVGRMYDVAWSPDWSQVATHLLGDVILLDPVTFDREAKSTAQRHRCSGLES